ncbi:PaaI family thioesterase [Hugenholtzia roseola]|uniref:PaaI family thioesterase n=1 Tax=Hugenholtzia roseola TaxID=1002 RepID=UPI0004000A3F|nr:hotdog fold thioesterase [Hugenholtzia roseola]
MSEIVYTPDLLNKVGQNTMVSHLGIEIVELGEDYIVGKMPVDARTVQPMRILHGGASVVLAETLGSLGAQLKVDLERFACVGLDINANHLRGVGEGNWVYGKATPIHVGRTTQVWEIRITDEQQNLICISRLTMAVVERKK